MTLFRIIKNPKRLPPEAIFPKPRLQQCNCLLYTRRQPMLMYNLLRHELFKVLCRMSRWTLYRVVTSDKRTVDFRQTFAAILECFCNVVRNLQGAFFVQQDINLNPNSITCMICNDRLVTIDKRRESICKICKLLQHSFIDGRSGKSENVGEAGGSPLKAGQHYIVEN